MEGTRSQDPNVNHLTNTQNPGVQQLLQMQMGWVEGCHSAWKLSNHAEKWVKRGCRIPSEKSQENYLYWGQTPPSKSESETLTSKELKPHHSTRPTLTSLCYLSPGKSATWEEDNTHFRKKPVLVQHPERLKHPFSLEILPIADTIPLMENKYLPSLCALMNCHFKSGKHRRKFSKNNNSGFGWMDVTSVCLSM